MESSKLIPFTETIPFENLPTVFGEESEEYNESTHAQGPGNPVSNRFYLQDQIEYDDIVIKAGLSYETWSPNNQGPDADGDGKADVLGIDDNGTIKAAISSGTSFSTANWIKQDYFKGNNFINLIRNYLKNV